MTQQIWRHGETRLLFLSALMMGVVAVGGLWMGIQSHSQAILLDGIFSVAAMIIKLLMMLTALLTRRKTGKRFPFGYWQCEPAVMLLEGIFTFFIVLYALVAGMWGLWHGGREVEFGTAVYYAAFFTLADWSFYGYVRRANKKVHSYLVHYDNVSWLIDAVLATGLLIGFGGARALQFTPYANLQVYVDPVIMMALGIQMIFPTVQILGPAIRQILGMAPVALHEHVQAVMDGFTVRYGFSDYVSRVQVFGRAEFIEIDILVAPDYPLQQVTELDFIRNEIAAALGSGDHEKRVTITFTTMKKWLARKYDTEERA